MSIAPRVPAIALLFTIYDYLVYLVWFYPSPAHYFQFRAQRCCKAGKWKLEMLKVRLLACKIAIEL